jgi:anhydro-N-acetylmuramic acid kinase
MSKKNPLDKLKNKKNINIVGIMSGTSMDGVDFVLVQAGGKQPTYCDIQSFTYPKKLRNDLLSLAEGKMSFRDSQKLHFELGDFYAKSLKKTKEQKNWKIDLIGLHGQTVFHDAPKATSQIGEPSFLKSFDVPVVSDFRSKILAAGGQGAPLAPLFHNELFKNKKKWAFLNIGGMTNISYRENGSLHATDLGPGNVFLDYGAQELFKKPYDKNGFLASRGLPDLKVVKWYLKENPFFRKRSPKSCGRKDFSRKDFDLLMNKMKGLDKHDVMATFSEITLQPVLLALDGKKIDTLVVSGGGAENNYLFKALDERLPKLEVFKSDDLGWPTQAVEGGAFAMLAFNKVFDVKPDLSFMKLKEDLGPLGRID